MRVFVYEYVTGGGLWRDRHDWAAGASLRLEANAMAAALVEDFTRLPGIQVRTLRDRRLGDFPCDGVEVTFVGGVEEQAAEFQRACRWADATMLIAPEWRGVLAELSVGVQRLGGRLLSPDASFVQLTSDKHLTCRRLAGCGVAAPRGFLWRSGQPLPEPGGTEVVIKPRDGAGSVGVRRLPRDARLESVLDEEEQFAEWRVEAFCPGFPVSVSVLSGPGGSVALPACSQQVENGLSGDGCSGGASGLKYRGGETPLCSSQAARARRLALAAVAALPRTTGYFGIDMVLGDDSTGVEDFVIEVNPRLTTSYVGLRQLARDNLTKAMIEISEGRMVPLSFHEHRVAFRADGRTTVVNRQGTVLP